MESAPKPSTTPTNRVTFPARAVAPLIVKVALVNSLVIAGAILLGRFLDAQFHAKVTFTVILAVVSLQLALFITYKLGMNTATQLEQADAKTKAETVTNVTAQESETTQR